MAAEGLAMMTNQTFRKRSHLDHSASEVFAWHARPGALERLTPPWSGISVESRCGTIRDEGSQVVLRMPAGPFGVRWVSTHHDFVDGSSFRDEQASGPFARWSHTHRVEPDRGDANGCTLEDVIEYRLPLAPLSTMVASRLVHTMLEQTFQWRHRRTREDLAAHARAALPASRIAVTGASGLVGGQLAAFLGTGGHDVRRVLRRTAGAPDEIGWDPAAGRIDINALEGMDAVVHLAGESIAAGRWTAESKRRILTSRTEGTRLLCKTLAGLERKPRVLVSASAIGFYGDRGDALLDETSAAGDGFLADVCRQWEAATAPAREAGIRVVNLRIGVVLTPLGGALAQMLTPFRFGVGGPLGSGSQFMSWISLDDLLGAILHCIATPSLEGPVNATAPSPVTNAELTRVLGAVLHRPAFLPVPAAALRVLLGEMSDALLLASTRVAPRRLLDSGFAARDPDLDGALRDMLGRGAGEAA
jgi:uncharacterized protein (TIGR01777 family)